MRGVLGMVLASSKWDGGRGGGGFLDLLAGGRVVLLPFLLIFLVVEVMVVGAEGG